MDGLTNNCSISTDNKMQEVIGKLTSSDEITRQESTSCKQSGHIMYTGIDRMDNTMYSVNWN